MDTQQGDYMPFCDGSSSGVGKGWTAESLESTVCINQGSNSTCFVLQGQKGEPGDIKDVSFNLSFLHVLHSFISHSGT